MRDNQKRITCYISLGKPGCGKGTFTETASEVLQGGMFNGEVFKSDTGQLIRNALTNQPGAVIFNQYHKDLFQKIQDAGKLQTSATATLHWCQHLRANYTGQPFMVIDGSPRRKFELFQIYEDLQETYDADIRFVYIEVSDEIAIHRMQERHITSPRGETSTIEKIQGRLEEFREKIYPTIQFIKTIQGVNFKTIANDQSLSIFKERTKNLIYQW